MGAERVVVHPSSDAWTTGWRERETRGRGRLRGGRLPRHPRARVGHRHLVDTRGDDEHLPVGMGRTGFWTVLAGLPDGWADTATLEVGIEDLSTIALGRENTLELLGTGRE
jgi:hypothetical protein